MNIIDRIKNILLTPNTEWDVINGENKSQMEIFKSYVIPLVLIGTITSFIGYGFFGMFSGMGFGLGMAMSHFVSGVASYFICSFVIDALAPTFKSEKNINKSSALVGYSFTAAWVAAVFAILPALAILGIVGLYSLYLLFIGLPKMKETQKDQEIPYFVVSLLVMIVCSFVIQTIMRTIMMKSMGLSLGIPGL